LATGGVLADDKDHAHPPCGEAERQRGRDARRNPKPEALIVQGLPTAFLGAAAGGIAVINMVGNSADHAAPQPVGLLGDLTGNYEVPLLNMGVLVALAVRSHAWVAAPACAPRVAEGS
jgi:hypothetical protein